ncbi:MAG: hypothetical protein HZB67_01545 [Candidatus Aenigmarchaeota archaeon]|nr:hypothetical protein [Candidatus Aenigmarchaeota archaeon]
MFDQSGGWGKYKENFNHGWYSFYDTGLLKDGDSLGIFELGIKKAQNLAKERNLIEELAAKSGAENKEAAAYRLRSNIRYVEHILEKFLERRWKRTVEGIEIPRRFEDYDIFASWLKDYFGVVLEPSEDSLTSIQRYNSMSELVQSIVMNRFIRRVKALRS